MTIETMDPAQEFEGKLIARMKPVNEVTALGTSAVQQFYCGTTVLLTGGTGFLGKQLIEKLFRATKISKMFVLLRSKQGKSIEERLIEILQDSVYDVLREQQPHFAEKIVAVSGDVGELRLGLSEKDWNTIIGEVDIIFHLAATTRFDEPLRTATLINVRGTREILVLGKACKKLRSFVYVSTAYAHARLDLINKEVSETFYKSVIKPSTMIQLAETTDEERINDITQGLTKDWPNTYTFAKSLAEDLVNTIGNDLPICIVRPAIVIASKLEPMPGWLDKSSVYGASGIILATGLGVMHVVLVDVTCRVELIPVDYVNNLIIATGWETARKRAIGENETKIYTVSPSSSNPINSEMVYKFMKEDASHYSTPMLVSYPFTWNTSSPMLFWLYTWLWHWIPAYIIDGINVILGKNRRFVKLATKMYRLSKALSFFNGYQWQFENKNTVALFDSLSTEDRMIFNFDVKDFDWREYMIIWCLGVRKYILKDGLKNTVYARKKYNFLRVLTFIIIPLYFYCLYSILHFALNIIIMFWQIPAKII